MHNVLLSAVIDQTALDKKLGVCVRSSLKMQHRHIQFDIAARKQMNDRAGWQRVEQKTYKDKRDRDVIDRFWHAVEQFDTNTPHKKRKWIAPKTYEEQRALAKNLLRPYR